MQVDYTYDALNRMVKLAYDADGAGSGATTNQYWAYDEGINALLEFNGSATTNLTHRYLWSDQVDELLADSRLTNLTTAGNALWALSDHLGTIRDIADYTQRHRLDRHHQPSHLQRLRQARFRNQLRR